MIDSNTNNVVSFNLYNWLKSQKTEDFVPALVLLIVITCIFIPAMVMSSMKSKEAQTVGSNLTVWGVAFLASDALVYKYLKSFYSLGIPPETTNKLNSQDNDDDSPPSPAGPTSDIKNPLHHTHQTSPVRSREEAKSDGTESLNEPHQKHHYRKVNSNDDLEAQDNNPGPFPVIASTTLTNSPLGQRVLDMQPHPGTVEYNRLRALKAAIVALAYHFKEGQRVNIREAEVCVIRVCEAFTNLYVKGSQRR